MKYKSNNAILDSNAVSFVYAHGRTLSDETIFKCFEKVINTLPFKKSHKKMIEDLEQFTVEKVLYTSSVSSGSIAFTAHYTSKQTSSIIENIQLIQNNYAKCESDVSSKNMETYFRKNRKILRENYLNLFDRLNLQKISDDIKDFNKMYKKINKNGLKEFNITKNTKKKYSYNNIHNNEIEIPDNLEEIMEFNRKQIYKYFTSNVDPLTFVSLKKVYEAILYNPKILDTNKKLRKSLMIPEYESNNIIKRKFKSLTFNKTTALKYINRNNSAIQILENLPKQKDYENFNNYKNNNVWFHQLINKTVYNTHLTLQPHDKDNEIKYNVRGVHTLFNVQNKKKLSDNKLLKNDDLQSCLDNIHKMNVCNNFKSEPEHITELLKKKKLHSKKDDLMIETNKKMLKDKLLNKICNFKIASTAEIIMLYWCFNYQHLTLYQHTCRGWTTENLKEKINRIQTPSSMNISKIKLNSSNLNKLNQINNKMIERVKEHRPRSKTSKRSSFMTKKKSSPHKTKKIIKGTSSNKSTAKVKTKKQRCPNDTRRNKITGNCDPIKRKNPTPLKRTSAPIPTKSSSSKRTPTPLKKTSTSLKKRTPTQSNKKKRCQNGTRRNKKTGECEKIK